MDTSSIFLIAIVIIVLIIFGGLLMLKLTIERAFKNVKVKPEHMSSAKASGKYTEFYNDHEDIPYNSKPTVDSQLFHALYDFDTTKPLVGKGGRAEGSFYDAGSVPSSEWEEYLRKTELDPAIEMSHSGYVKDVSRFWTGANFTQVADDNRDVFSTNFIGLRRPKHVPIGEDARQQQDVDENILKRNKRFLL